MTKTIQLDLCSPARKWAVLASVLLVSSLYLISAAAQLAAAYLGKIPDPGWLKLALRIDPGNAEARHSLGRLELLRQSPQSAQPWLRSATELNPYNGRYWADLALAQQASGDTELAQRSLQRALAVDSHTPRVAWDAANLYLGLGATDNAMKELSAVLENDPDSAASAISACWKVRPDIDYLLGNVIPSGAYPQLLAFLIAREQTDAAAKVWQVVFSSRQEVARPEIFDYIRYLVLHREAAQAARVWQEAASVGGLQGYQPSTQNLLVNGDFSLAVLNGGFDWVHKKVAGVALALDPKEAHTGPQSLRISFDGPGIYDAGISQIVAVEPSTDYEFSAFYKTDGMDGAGGMEFAIQDAYAGTSFFRSEDLREADFWKKTGGSFHTGPATQLVIVRIVRVPSGSPIKGTLWIDGLQLISGSDAVPRIALGDTGKGAQ